MINVVNRSLLKDKYPNIFKEINIEKSKLSLKQLNTLSSYSHKNIFFTCSKGHNYQVKIYSRTVNNSNCPYCSGNKVLSGFNDLKTLFPTIAKEWDYAKNYQLKPETISAYYSKNVYWICSKGHSYETTVNSRTSKRSGCPYCAGQKVLTGYNDLLTLFPNIAKEYSKNNDVLADKIMSKSNKPVKWICFEGHEYEASPNTRINMKTGCPYCSNHKVLTGYNDLLTKFPDIAKEYSKDNPTPVDKIVFGSHAEVKWICSRGHEYKTLVVNRTGRDKSGCPYCSGNKVLSGYNDLLTKFPLIAVEYSKDNIISVDQIMPGSHKIVKWICPKGHEYTASVNNRTDKNSGCPYCSHRKLLTGYNDLLTLFPDIAKEYSKDNLIPVNQIIGGSGKSVKWVCSKGHEYITTVIKRTCANGGKCPYCSNKKLLSGYNDLLTRYPLIASEYSKDNPIPVNQIMPGSHKIVKWICPKGHEYMSTVNNRTSGRNCPCCKRSKGEILISNCLDKLNIEYHSEYIVNDLISNLRFDFYIFQKDKFRNNIAIEFDGKQHFEPAKFFGGDEGLKNIQQRDKRKNEYCKRRGIKLLRIKYSEVEKLTQKESNTYILNRLKKFISKYTL